MPPQRTPSTMATLHGSRARYSFAIAVHRHHVGLLSPSAAHFQLTLAHRTDAGQGRRQAAST